MANKKKQTVRAKSLQIREALTRQERASHSLQIVKNLTSLACYQEADALLVYVSYRSEVETIGLIRKAVSEGKHVFVPKVEGKTMEFYRITELSELHEGYRGIWEPDAGESYMDYLTGMQGHHPAQPETISHTLLCMPGAAFDQKRHRIGYGGGFFDRYLEKLTVYQAKGMVHLITAALAYSCQVWEEIPWEPHDITPDMILTERRIF